MKKEQYENYANQDVSRKRLEIQKDFSSDFEGTLLHGTLMEDGDMFHLYIKDNYINMLIYYSRWGQSNVVEHIKTKSVDDIEDILEGKRVYPEASSWDFVSLLSNKYVRVCLGSYNENVPRHKEGSFYPLALTI